MVDLKWIDGSAPKSTPTGTSFGVPWSQGEIDKTTPISVSSSDGGSVPVQTWPLAYWPDGSLKWTGHTLPANAGLSDKLTLKSGTPAEPSNPVSVNETDSDITVTTGNFSAKFNKSGPTLISSLSLGGNAQVSNGTLVVHVQDAPDEPEIEGPRPTVTATSGTIDDGGVTAEQKGPVRAVIKVTGKYKDSSGNYNFLPFIVRFYVSAGATTIRMVHFFIWDADQQKDFIKGIGLRFQTPLSDALYNRHIRFVSAAGGIWGEPVLVMSGLRRDATAAVLTPQFNGTATTDPSTWPTSIQPYVKDLPLWSDFTLDQLSPDVFGIRKRSVNGAGGKINWVVDTGGGIGTRAAGVGCLGGSGGGSVAFVMKDFWQGAPRSIDIRDAATDTGTVTLWAWSPRAEAMDMRHYDTVAHGLDLAYEDVGDPDPDPTGIGRSYEVSLQLFPSTPARDVLAQIASLNGAAPQIVASPDFYAGKKIFGGRWSTPSTSNSTIAGIEKRKSDLLDFYVAEVEQRKFYGFWNYGDIMHTYDQTRHGWRYDVGGYAWDNGELGSDLWLWMSFLRTGRADVFRMASAMTRHISEVDSHHTGPYAGIGSRHNVSHWGDGAKEARVAGSTLRRPFYYLTTDELMGDIMDYTLQADQTIMTWDPLRKALPPPPPAARGRLRIGPDWTTLAGNWFTKWERTNDDKWKARLVTSMTDIGNFQYGLFTGNTSAVGWDADTAHLLDIGGEGQGSYHLTMIFGGGEFLMEAMDLMSKDVPAFDAAWVDFCKYYNASDADKTAKYGKTWNSGGFGQLYAKLQCYAGQRLNDTTLKQAAWNIIIANKTGVWPAVTKVGGTDVLNPINEIANLATNDAGSLSLSEYAVIAIAPELAPSSFVPLAPSLLSRKSLDWEQATLAGSMDGDKRAKEKDASVEIDGGGKGKKLWRRLFCM